MAEEVKMVKFSRKYTQAQFTALAAKDAETIYFIKDSGAIYLGSTLIAEANKVASVNNKTGAVTVKEANNFMSVTYTNNNGSSSQITYAPCTNDNSSKTLQEITFNSSQFSGNVSDGGHVLNLALNTVNSQNFYKPESSDYLVTRAWLDSEIASKIAASDAMVFKGTLGTGGTKTTLPTNNITVGDTYKVITAGGYGFGNSSQGNAGTINVKVGDLVVALKSIPSTGTADANTWIVIPSGDEAVTTIQIDANPNVTTTAQTGTIKLGSVVTKAVSTSLNDGRDSHDYVPTSLAVFNYTNKTFTHLSDFDDFVNNGYKPLLQRVESLESTIINKLDTSTYTNGMNQMKSNLNNTNKEVSTLKTTVDDKLNIDDFTDFVDTEFAELETSVEANTTALTWD